MTDKPRILIAGETWVTTSTHVKGFDSFSTSSFGEGYSYLKAALERGGFEVDVIENHVAALRFPTTVDELGKYSMLILSDIGANTLLLTPKTWREAKPTENRLHVIADFVRRGGGLAMIGGYLTFTGIEAKGFWRNTPVEQVLPVRLSQSDDRSERPEGISPEVVDPNHPILKNVQGEWPRLLGYNRVSLAPEAKLLATIGPDPLLAIGEAGEGRAVAFTSDCSPHWCPTEFVAWPGYDALWRDLCRWAARVS
jgi:uncharacterized membrane protein